MIWHRQEDKLCRRHEKEGGGAGSEFELESGGNDVGLFLGLFAGGNRLAQRAGVMAVKGLGYRLGKGLRAQIAREHCRPGDRLQGRPMRPGGKNQGGDQEILSEGPKH